uniref:Uncharacterized protein n=1 Tax=Meloidogyne hapla TaxID=6305 RepID=A0A1I8BZM8_MELHA
MKVPEEFINVEQEIQQYNSVFYLNEYYSIRWDWEKIKKPEGDFPNLIYNENSTEYNQLERCDKLNDLMQVNGQNVCPVCRNDVPPLSLRFKTEIIETVNPLENARTSNVLGFNF